jgi:ubiquinol-cytochrome c reductase cytochrome b subunit
MYIGHVLILPVVIGGLLTLHVALIVARHHTQFRRGPEGERAALGFPTFPAYAPRSLGLGFAVAAVLFLLGGLIQINPIWLWGPFHLANGTNGAQPDWYLGWLIGGLRLVPGFDWVIDGYTLVPNPFWGGAALPLVVFAILFAWPSLERRLTGDDRFHNVLDRPRDAPWRTAIGSALLSFVALVFLFGASDRVYYLFGISYSDEVWVFRVLVWVLPIVVGAIAYRACKGLQDQERIKRRRKAAEAAAAAEGEGQV